MLTHSIYPSLEALTSPRKLEIKAFLEDKIRLEDPIEKHVSWAYSHIYSVDYSEYYPRNLHGIQHVTRVAAYIPVLMNLYSRYGVDVPADDLKLIQIAALFHDSGRMDDGADEWDAESGALLYHYLTAVLKVDEVKAKLLADAVTNKDKTPKNIYQKLIHDADCLDVMRVRSTFFTTQLDFYQEIAKNNSRALDELAQLTTEVHSLIRVHEAQPERYNCQEAYAAIKTTMVNPSDEEKLHSLQPTL